MIKINDLETPALLLDIKALDNNLEKMAKYFKNKSASLRPHAKTHKCSKIAERQIGYGAAGITCATLAEAAKLAEKGIKNILIANEIANAISIRKIIDIAEKCDLLVACDDLNVVRLISDVALKKDLAINILADVNIGMNRCGLKPGKECLEFVKRIEALKGVRFKGLMGYEGHCMFIADTSKRRAEAEKAVSSLITTAELLKKENHVAEIVSVGGSGTYNISGDIKGVTEIQAGSYALMDTRYKQIIPEFQYSLSILSTVVSAKSNDRIVIDCGLKKITKEFGMPLVKGRKNFEIWMLCEEQAVLTAHSGPRPAIGDKLELLPSHVCTTVNLHDKYYVIKNGKLIDVWEIDAK